MSTPVPFVRMEESASSTFERNCQDEPFKQRAKITQPFTGLKLWQRNRFYGYFRL